MEKSAQRVDALKAKMSALASVKTPTQEYKDISKQIADTEKKQAALNDRMDKFVELGGNTESRQYKSMQYDMAELENTIMYAKGELQDLVDTGKAFTLGSDSNEFSSLNQQLSEEQARLNELSKQYENLHENLSSASKIEIVANGFRKVSDEAQNTFAKIAKGSVAAWGNLKKVIPLLGNMAKGFASFSGKAMSALTGVGRVSNTSGGMVEHFGKRVLGLLKTVFVFGIIRRALTAFKNGVQDGFGSYLKYDSSLKSAIAGLQAQLNGLKGSLASAFAPIVSTVVPYLSTLISWATTAANAVAQFIAVLTGHSSYKKAVANVGAVGAAADGAAGSLGNATKAAEDLEKALGSYDELKVIDQPKDSSGGGSGGSGGGGGTGAGDISYEDVEIASAISDFAEKVKEAWMKSDFTEIGGIIGGKLNEALQSIPWSGIQETASNIGKDVATLINGFVETSGLGNTVGKTVGELLNTGIAGAGSYMSNLHWGSVGQFIADSMNSFIKTANWEGAGEAVRDGLNGVFQLASTWSAGFNFGALGAKVSSLINAALGDITWSDSITFSENVGEGIGTALNKVITQKTLSNVGSTFAGVINTVLSGAHSLIGKIEWKNWGSAIGGSINKFFADLDWKKAGLTFADGAKGICDTLASAVKTISWSSVGTGIAEALKTVPWGELLKSVADLICSTFSGLIDFGGAVLGRLGGDEWRNYMLDVKEATKEIQNANDEIERRITTASEWSKAGEEYDYAQKLAEEYFDLAEQEGLTNDEKDRMKELAGQLKATIPELETYYNTETGLLDTTRDSVDNLIESLKAKARTEAAQEALKELYSAQMDAKKAMDEAQKTVDTLAESEAELTKKRDEALEEYDEYVKRYGIEAAEGTNAAGALRGYNTELEDVHASQELANKALKDATDNYNRAGTEIDRVTSYVSHYSDEVDGASGKTDNLAKKLKDLSKESQVTISIKGMDASMEEKIKVIAEVTGTDYSKIPADQKTIENTYAEIVGIYQKTGEMPSVDAKGKIVSAQDNLPEAERNLLMKANFTTMVDKIPENKKNISGAIVEASKLVKQSDTVTLRDVMAYAKNVGWTGDAKKMLEIQALTKSVGWDKNPNKGVTVAAITKEVSWGPKAVKEIAATVKTDKITNPNKKGTSGPINASKITNTGKKGTSGSYNVSKVTNTKGKGTSGPINVSKITNNNNKIANAKINITGQANTPTVKVKAQIAAEHAARGLSKGGAYSQRMWRSLPQKALGGILSHNIWRNIPAYAAGGNPHGTMFVAGEAGPEIVGHVGGRTEVLNKSQLASTMYSAVLSGMRAAVNDLGRAVFQHMTECTNTVIANMGYIVDAIYNAASILDFPQMQLAVPSGYAIPDSNRTNFSCNPGGVGGIGIDYDKLADSVAARLSGSIEIPIEMHLDGNTVYRDMVRIDRETVKQTGKSGFER